MGGRGCPRDKFEKKGAGGGEHSEAANFGIPGFAEMSGREGSLHEEMNCTHLRMQPSQASGKRHRVNNDCRHGDRLIAGLRAPPLRGIWCFGLVVSEVRET